MNANPTKFCLRSADGRYATANHGAAGNVPALTPSTGLRYQFSTVKTAWQDACDPEAYRQAWSQAIGEALSVEFLT